MTMPTSPEAVTSRGADSIVSEKPRTGHREREPTELVIGLVNNMPDGAFRATEDQFVSLLSSAATTNVTVRLRLFTLPDVPRPTAGQAEIAERYENIDQLWGSRLDGLIVSGTEPRASALTEEPYWESLTKLVDWAGCHTISTIWSCLAAHAAVLHLDRIEREPFPAKLSGIFECGKASDHILIGHRATPWAVPHSRHNGLSEDALIAKGYEILSRSPKTGPDIFAKTGQSLFLFLQGHPEYDLGALLQEYRRDVGRFLCGKRAQYPEMPYGYFDRPTEAIFSTFRERAVRNPSAEMFAQFPAISREALSHKWREAAIHLYGDWLSFLQAHKASTSKAGERDQPVEKPNAVDNILYLTPSTPVHAESSDKNSEPEVEKCDRLTG